MNAEHSRDDQSVDANKPPLPIVRKMHWPFPIIWIVPLAAACLAGYYVYQHHLETGSEIVITFDDGWGIKPDETRFMLHGVTIGHVKSIELANDHQHANVHIQLSQQNSFIARAQTVFWLVRPELSLQNITGLSTIVSGPYIDCRPGEGAAIDHFDGLNSAPPVIVAGIKIIVTADQIAQLSIHSPVNYRGIQVGVVKDIRLSSLADGVNVTLEIWDRYTSLIRTNSQFWMIKGADIQGSLFSGLSLKLGSVQNLLSGGVAFATPEKNAGRPVTEGAKFQLHDQPEDDWLKWKTKIELPPETLPKTLQPGGK